MLTRTGVVIGRHHDTPIDRVQYNTRKKKRLEAGESSPWQSDLAVVRNRTSNLCSRVDLSKNRPLPVGEVRKEQAEKTSDATRARIARLDRSRMCRRLQRLSCADTPVNADGTCGSLKRTCLRS